MRPTTAAPTLPGTYPTGRPGVARRWDGEVWVGAPVASPDAPTIHARRSLRHTLGRSPFWWGLGGIVVGVLLTVIGVSGDHHIRALLLVGGFVATGGPILALALGMRRRLGLAALDTRQATVAGLVSGVVAIGVALGLERLVGHLLGSKAGDPNEGLLILAGPIEEGAKLLVPVILLAAGAAVVRTPRLGVWAVLVSSSLFGAIEGALYAAGIGGAQDNSTSDALKKAFPGLSDNAGEVVKEIMTVVPRIWVEIGHPLWTTGAAVIIWLAAHNRARAISWVTLGAFLIAAALHSFNDGVLPLLPNALPALASMIWITLGYLLWFRPQVRRLVPPEALAEVPERWIPRVPPAAGQ